MSKYLEDSHLQYFIIWMPTDAYCTIVLSELIEPQNMLAWMMTTIKTIQHWKFTFNRSFHCWGILKLNIFQY